MKNLFLILLSCSLFTACTRPGYVSGGAGVTVSAGMAPAWMPSGFAGTMRYYYMPELMLYYDTWTGNYFFFNGFRWVRTAYMPSRFMHYNFGNVYIMQFNYGGTRPYREHARHHREYHHRNIPPVKEGIARPKVQPAPNANRRTAPADPLHNRPSDTYTGPERRRETISRPSPSGDTYRNAHRPLPRPAGSGSPAEMNSPGRINPSDRYNRVITSPKVNTSPGNVRPSPGKVSPAPGKVSPPLQRSAPPSYRQNPSSGRPSPSVRPASPPARSMPSRSAPAVRPGGSYRR